LIPNNKTFLNTNAGFNETRQVFTNAICIKACKSSDMESSSFSCLYKFRKAFKTFVKALLSKNRVQSTEQFGKDLFKIKVPPLLQPVA